MRHLITNVSADAVGISGGHTLAPGESTEIILDDEQLKEMEAFANVTVEELLEDDADVSDVDRPKGRKNQK